LCKNAKVNSRLLMRIRRHAFD